MDVGGWLRSLGLDQYEQNFRDNRIEADVLPQLTADDLKDIGVSAVGDRRRLLSAIAALATATPPPDLLTLKSSAPPKKTVEVTAERRPITVLFCDLVGSTSLAATLGAEDWRNLVNAYLDAASKAVASLGGHVLKRLGDGLMALFGYPQAQENDAERAVRAALSIQRVLSDINARNAAKGAPELSARIGIDSGPAVVEANGEVFGDAPNIAARVEAAAEAGAVLVTLNVQRQLAGLFVAEDAGARELKGVAAPVQLFRIVRASGGGRRGGARALTPFVGREEELAILARRWASALAGEGQFVLVVGEPGLGKSRLVAEFHARLAETPHTWSVWAASQLLQNTPLHPIAEWGRQRFGADAPPDDRLADLESTLELVGLDPAEHAPLLAPLVDIPLPAELAVNLPPEELRRRQLTAMTAWVLAGARSQPIVLAFEDLHWADPTSLNLLRSLAERGAQAPLLVLATTRPEFRPPWSLRSHHSLISLSPLDRAGVARMVGEISASHALSKEVVDGVSERTGGVPLFVEEVTRLLLERGDERGAHAIPPTLQQSLAARLDRLGNAREIAQIGAVLGREFSYRLIRDVAEADEAALQASLDRLAEADLLYVEGLAPDATYRFKHALIQDAAYDSLLKSRRQALHRRAAEVLRDNPERAAAPEMIAHHFTEAGLDDLAIEWWGKAGDQALRRSAFQEAIAHLAKAIAMADKAAGASPAGSAADTDVTHQRLKLQTGYGEALMYSKGFAAHETKVAFARAAEMAGSARDFEERSTTLRGQFRAAASRGDLRSAKELASLLLIEGEKSGSTHAADTANGMLGLVAYWRGDFAATRTHCQRALRPRDSGVDTKNGEPYRPGIGYALSFLSMALWQLGEVERARETIDLAIQRASEDGQVGGIADALFWRMYLEVWRGDPSATLIAANALEPVAREHSMGQYLNETELYLGWVRGRMHDPAAGAAQIRRALDAFVERGVKVNLGFYNGLLAQLEAETLGADAALVRLDEAFRLSNEVEHGCSLPFLHRLRGQILLKRGPIHSASAEEAFRTSIAIATRQGAHSPVLLASLALAKLYQSTGRPVDGHAVLTPALEGFAPTPEMPEIAEAQSLLGALAETDEVKAAKAQRDQRLHLQTTYGKAMMMARGYAAEDTRAAFARAAELAGTTDDFSERFATLQGQFGAACTAGELAFARKIALTLLHDVENAGLVWETSAANGLLGLIAFWRGDFVEARTRCERALDAHDPTLNRKMVERFGDGVSFSSSILAATMWQLGEVERARELIELAVRRATESGHVETIALTLFWRSYLEIWRGDPSATLDATEALEPVARRHGLVQFLNEAKLHSAWARGRISDPMAGAAQVQRVLAAFVEQSVKVNLGFYTGLLAQLEAETLDADSALLRLDEGLRLSRQVEHGCSLPFLHRLRGQILLKRDPPDPASAEEAFRTSIAIAKQQGARTPVLLASLPLAKHFQSTGRPVDAHDVLAPALEGFAPTPEMPEIAEAQALMGRLA